MKIITGSGIALTTIISLLILINIFGGNDNKEETEVTETK